MWLQFAWRAVYHGLPSIDAVEKEEMRALAIRGGPFTAKEAHDLIEYCASDVMALRKLFAVMIQNMTEQNLAHTLLRGEWMKGEARIMNLGIPMDVPMFNLLRTG